MAVHDVEYLLELRDAVVESLAEIDHTQARLDAILRDHADAFKSLLDRAPRSSEARTKVQSGKVELSVGQCEVNKDFIDQTLQLSDDLDVDEVVAAEWLFHGSANAVKYDRDALAAARYVYHASRLILLDTLFQIARTCVEAGVSLDWQDIFSRDVPRMAKDCIEAMALARARLATLEETAKRNELLRTNATLVDAAYIERSLHEEHELLALLAYELLRCEATDLHGTLREVFDYLRSVEKVSLPAAHAWLLVTLSIQLPALVGADADQTSSTFRKWRDTIGEQPWRNASLRSTVQIAFASELNGLCRQNDQMAADFEYEADILSVANAAADSFCFESLVAMYMFCNDDVDSSAQPFVSFMSAQALSHFVPSHRASSSERFIGYVAESYRLLASSCISHLPDVLKQTQIAEEDARRAGETEVAHNFELFLGTIYIGHLDELDSGLDYFEDRDGDLFGFLAWGAQWRSPSLVYAYYMMLSALVRGSRSAALAATLLDGESALGDTVTWQFMFDAVRYYARQLTPGGNPVDIPEMDMQSAFTLVGYLALIRGLAKHMPTKDVEAIQTRFDCQSGLLQLMACRIPPELQCALSRTLAALVRSPDVQIKTWSLLDAWLGAVEAVELQTMGYASVRRAHSNSRSRVIALLNTFCGGRLDVTTALIDLLHELHRHRAGLFVLPQPSALSSDQLGEYATFVLGSLSACFDDAAGEVVQRLGLLRSCLAFIETILGSLHTTVLGDVANIANVGERRALSAGLLSFYESHVGVRLLKAVVERARVKELTRLITIDDSGDRLVGERLRPCKELVLQILEHCLINAPYVNEFLGGEIDVTAITSDVDVVVQIAVEAATQSSAPALAILAQLQRGNGAHRLLVALDTADQSKAILHGFIGILQKTDTPQAISVLALLRNELQTSSIGIGHFILGFAPTANATQVTTGEESGQVGSGVSVLDYLIELVFSDEVQDDEQQAVAAEILALLCKAPSTGPIVLGILRDTGYLIKAFEVDASEGERTASFVRRRSALLAMSAREVLEFVGQGLTLSMEKWVAAILPKTNSNGFGLISWLDVIDMDCPPPSIEGQWSLIQPHLFAAIVAGGHDIAKCLARVDTLLELKLQQVRTVSPELATQEADNMRATLHDYLVASRLRERYLEYVSRWTSLTTVVLSGTTQKLEARVVRRLLAAIDSRLGLDADAALVLSDALAAISSHVDLQDSHDRVRCIKETITCITSPSSSVQSREQLYTALLAFLGAAAAAEADMEVTSLVRTSGGDRLLHLLCHDATLSDGARKATCLLLLDLLASQAQSAADPWLAESLQRANLVNRLADDFFRLLAIAAAPAASTRSDAQAEGSDALESYFSLLSRLAASRRECARELLQGVALVSRCCQARLFDTDAVSFSTPRAARAARLLLVACLGAGLREAALWRALQPYAEGWHIDLVKFIRRAGAPPAAGFAAASSAASRGVSGVAAAGGRSDSSIAELALCAKALGGLIEVAKAAASHAAALRQQAQAQAQGQGQARTQGQPSAQRA